MKEYDFSGWATKANIRCADGRTILPDAFKENDGKKVPLVWNHRHDTPINVLGHAQLVNKNDGVYAYCSLNDTEMAQEVKKMIKHGDISALSIYANDLKQKGLNVIHGAIREVSLVLAPANPSAYIDTVLQHNEFSDEEAIIYSGEGISLFHSEVESKREGNKDDKEGKDDKTDTPIHQKTYQDIIDTMNEEQKQVFYEAVAQALEEKPEEDIEKKTKKNRNESEGGNKMKHNLFDKDTKKSENTLSHSDVSKILNLAKSNSVGSLQSAIGMFAEEQESLSHGIDGIETLFPDYKDVYPGAPEKLSRDLGWVSTVMNGTHKSPISRIRTRQVDVRGENLGGHGYVKGEKKTASANVKLLNRTTDPQTVYRKDALLRDDIIDIVDFDVVEYQYQIMKDNLYEELARAIMIGDGRDEGDANKIYEEHIRSIWNDNDIYAIHTDVDYAAAKLELQGTNTNVNFGDNYIKAEATISAALYSREKYKGSGNLTYFCTPHSLNVMLLARDINGRRIYSSKSELIAALNVKDIVTVEQFEGRTRKTKDNKTKKLVGIFVDLADYQVGSTKGGEITRFNQFDIDFNQEKYLIETRVSGALTKAYSAIVLEEDVTETIAG